MCAVFLSINSNTQFTINDFSAVQAIQIIARITVLISGRN